MLAKAVVAAIVWLSAVTLVYAQATEPPPINQNTDHFLPVSLISDREFVLSMAVLGFGLCALLMELILLCRIHVTADEIMRTLTVTLIVVVSLTLVSSGFGEKQITPVLGLFGTIFGYLLGSAKQCLTSQSGPPQQSPRREQESGK